MHLITEQFIYHLDNNIIKYNLQNLNNDYYESKYNKQFLKYNLYQDKSFYLIFII